MLRTAQIIAAILQQHCNISAM